MRRIKHRGFEINFVPPDVSTGGSLVMPAQVLAANGGILIPGTAEWGQAAEALAATGNIQISGTGAFSSAAEALAATGNIQIPGTGALSNVAETLAGTANVMPLGVSGAQLWLRADLGTTIATGVSQWNDQSGNGHNFAQATGSKQPTVATVNGQTSLRFTRSSSQSLTLATGGLAQPFDIFIVAQSNSANAQACMFDCNPGNGAQVLGYLSGNTTTVGLFAGTGFTATSSNMSSTLSILRFSFAGTSSALYQNGTSIGTGTSGSNARLIGCIGQNEAGANFWDGWISEIIVYNSTLSSTDATNVTRYLGTRYGISVP